MYKVLDLVSSPPTSTNEHTIVEPPFLASQFNKPDKDIAVQEHQTRFAR